MRTAPASVAATGTWTDPDGVRLPSGEVHGWRPGTNQTLCGLSLHRSRLTRFPHVVLDDTDPASGGAADAVRRVCPRCLAAAGRGRGGRRWQRRDPRP
ncbi:hypothetical protein [Thalassiella azotivora]